MQKKINEVMSKLNNIKEEYSLALVGSTLQTKNYNDIDFLLVTECTDVVKEKIKDLFRNYQIKQIDDAIRVVGLLDTEVSIAIYNKSNFDDIVNNFLTGNKIICEHRTWATGYWFSEGLMGDIDNSKILKDEGYLQEIKNKLNTYPLYAKRKIVEDCTYEILSKGTLLSEKRGIEFNLLKNDIILAFIRLIYCYKGEYLKSFKNIDEIIKTLPAYNYFIIKKFIDSNSTKEIIDYVILIYNQEFFQNRLYYGTWQFSGDFKKLNEKEIVNLIKYAKKKGINRFDTALVYGKGKVEKILGEQLDDTDIILTKIPAMTKPLPDDNFPLLECYTEQYILDCLKTSLNNLKREKIDIVLLHNWIDEWNNEKELIRWLVNIKQQNLVNKVGISLPNGYNGNLKREILNQIDVIEVPYNDENNWILQKIEEYKKHNVEIILRSLFKQGKVLDNNEKKYFQIIEQAKQLNTSIVIGMTTETQIDNNIKIMKKR